MTRALGSASPTFRSAAVAAAFASLYFLTTKLTGWLSGEPGVLWPASGVYLGVMLVAPRHLWPVLACAAGVGSLLTYLDGGTSLELSVAFAVPSSAEGLLAALLVERIAGRRFTLAGPRDLLALVVGGAVVANGLVALSAAAVAAQSFGVSFAESWLRWWSADALGMLAVVPIFTARRWELRAAGLAGLVVGLVGTHVASEVYVLQGLLAVLLLGSLALAAAAHERERLRDVLGRSNEELERRRRAADHTSHELEGSAERLERAGRRIAQLTGELAARRAEVHEATRRRERLTADLRDSQAARERTERVLGDARDQLSQMSAENDALDEELSRVSAQNGALEEALSRVSGRNKALEEELSRARAESGALEEELSRAGAESGALGEELSRARAESGALGEELSRARAESGALEDELSRTRAESGALEEELSRAGAESGALGEELSRARAESGALEEELSRARAESGALRQEIESVRPEQARISEELAEAVSDRRRAEEALDQARALLLEERARLERSLDETTATLARTEAERRLLADHATELIARYDERGTCLYASPASRRLLGYEPDELVGRAGAELLHPEDIHLLARARATRSESVFEARLRRKAGDYIRVEVRLRPFWTSDGDRLVAINTTIRDISRHPDLAEPFRGHGERAELGHTQRSQNAA